MFVAHPAIWDLLLLPEGERLAAAYGLIPASLLFGPEAYAESLRPRVIRLLLLRRKVVFEGLTDHVLRHNNSFRKLLARSDISDEHLCTALAKLETTKNAGGRSELLRHYLNAPSDKLEEELVVRVDFESWDDSLPSYLKVVSRLGQGRPLDPGDLPKAGIEAIGDLAAFFPEPIAESLTAFTGVPVSEQVVASTIETLKKGAGHMVDQAFREDLERRAAAARRGEALLSSEDTRLLEAEERRPLVERAILDQLQAMNAARRDEHPEVVGRTIRFFHSRVPTCHAAFPTWTRFSRLSGSSTTGWSTPLRLPAPPITDLSRLDRKAWAKSASRWWQVGLDTLNPRN